MTYKTKLFNSIIIGLILFGILMIFINSFVQIYTNGIILKNMKYSINLTKNISSVVFHLQKERGYTNLYLNGNKNVYSNIIKEKNLVDSYFTLIKNINEKKLYFKNIDDLESKLNSLRVISEKQIESPINIFSEYTTLINEFIDYYNYPIKQKTTSETGKLMISIYFLEKMKEYAGEFRGIYSSIIKEKHINDKEYTFLNKSFYNIIESTNYKAFQFTNNTYNKISNFSNSKYYKTLWNYYNLIEKKSNELYKLNPEETFKDLTSIVNFFQDLINYELLNLTEKININLKKNKIILSIDIFFLIFSIILLIYIMLNYYKVIKLKNNLKYLATHDLLTKLPNRLLFFEKSKNLISLGERNNLKYAIMFIDIDNFKKVNDTFGHKSGDDILKKMAQTLKKILRNSDIISRFGGDEFVILTQYKNIEDIYSITQKLNNNMAKRFEKDGKSFTVSLSIGISLFPEHSKNIDELIKFADIAMYKAKQQKNSTIIYSKKYRKDL